MVPKLHAAGSKRGANLSTCAHAGGNAQGSWWSNSTFLAHVPSSYGNFSISLDALNRTHIMPILSANSTYFNGTLLLPTDQVHTCMTMICRRHLAGTTKCCNLQALSDWCIVPCRPGWIWQLRLVSPLITSCHRTCCWLSLLTTSSWIRDSTSPASPTEIPPSSQRIA